MFRFLLTKLFTKREKMKGDDVKPFLDHLEDLRGTLFKMALTLVVTMSICGIWYKDLFALLEYPLVAAGYDPRKVLFFGVFGGGIMSAITIVFYSGLVVGFPVLVFFLGEFVMPAMTEKEKRYALPTIVAGFALFLLGAAFCFHYIMPTVSKFMIGFNAGIKIQDMVEARSYFKTVALMVLVFGLFCQLPVVMIGLHGVGIITYKWISSTRSYAYTGILVLCGVVSPTPDIPSLVLVTVPIIGLYEICIWIIYFIEKRRPKDPVDEKPSIAPLAVTPYAAAQPASPAHEHHDDPYHHDDHYNDGHYHDEHYHREHSDYYDEHKTEAEVKADEAPKPAEPEVKADDSKPAEPEQKAEPKSDEKPPEDAKP